jgi:hypothetical protein
MNIQEVFVDHGIIPSLRTPTTACCNRNAVRIVFAKKHVITFIRNILKGGVFPESGNLGSERKTKV